MITDQILQGHGPHYRWLRVPVNTWLALHVLVNLNPSESDSTPNLLFSSRSRSDLGRSIVRRINLPPPRDQCRRIARMESRSPPQRNRQYRSGFQDGSSPSPSPASCSCAPSLDQQSFSSCRQSCSSSPCCARSSLASSLYCSRRSPRFLRNNTTSPPVFQACRISAWGSEWPRRWGSSPP